MTDADGELAVVSYRRDGDDDDEAVECACRVWTVGTTNAVADTVMALAMTLFKTIHDAVVDDAARATAAKDRQFNDTMVKISQQHTRQSEPLTVFVFRLLLPSFSVTFAFPSADDRILFLTSLMMMRTLLRRCCRSSLGGVR